MEKERSSHHHHHHHHHKKSSKKQFSIKRFACKYKTPLRIVAAVGMIGVTVLATVLIIGMVQQQRDLPVPQAQPQMQKDQIPQGHIALVVTDFGKEVSLSGEALRTYLSTSTSVSAEEVLKPFSKDGVRLDIGTPLTLSYDVLGLPANTSVSGYFVRVTEASTNLVVFEEELRPGQSEIELYNLKTSERYDYRIRARFTNRADVEITGSFTTAAGPRLLNVSGIGNIRDFGGWKTASGKIVKQGLLIRGTELDGENDNRFVLASDGRWVLQNILKIRTDLDLRQTTETANTKPYGDYVVNYAGPMNMPFFADAFNADKVEAVRQVFRELANPDNYPIYMHCTLGRDRTGTVCLILGSLLGMEEQDLMKEYGLSALYYDDVDYANATAVLSKLKTYEGENLAEKAESYLLSIGVKPAEIAALRTIFLG